MIKGFDCFAPVTAEVLLRAKAAGMTFVARYYGQVGSRKLLLADEVELIGAAGFRIFSVFEGATRGRPLGGMENGNEDGRLAVLQAQAAHQPSGTTITFAVDLDPDMSMAINRNMLHDYFLTAGALTKAAGYKVGGYGGGNVLDYLLIQGLISVAWLAGAMGWAGSREFDTKQRWHVRQHPEIAPGGYGNQLGIGYDPNDAISADVAGMWLPSAAAPSPAPATTGPIDLFELQRKLKAEGLYSPKVDGVVTADGATVKGLVTYSARHRPARSLGVPNTSDDKTQPTTTNEE